MAPTDLGPTVDEGCFVFAHDPLFVRSRTMEITHYRRSEHARNLMSPASNIYKNQGQRTLKWARNVSAKATKTKGLNYNALHSLVDHVAKGRGSGDGEGKVGGTQQDEEDVRSATFAGRSGAASGSALETVDADEVMGTTLGHDDPPAQEEGPKSTRRISGKHAQSLASSPRRSRRSRTPPSNRVPQRSPAFMRLTSFAVGGGGLTESPDGLTSSIGFDDSASQRGGVGVHGGAC